MSLFHDYIKIKREIDAMEESGALLASIHVQLLVLLNRVSLLGTSINLYKRKLKKRVVQHLQIGYEGYKYATCQKY